MPKRNLFALVGIPVYVFRPTKVESGQKLYRYAAGLWVPDDGSPDLAFASAPNSHGPPMAYYVDIQAIHGKQITKAAGGDFDYWHYRDLHMNGQAGDSAMHFTSYHHSCANGRTHTDAYGVLKMLSEINALTVEYLAASRQAYEDWMARVGIAELDRLTTVSSGA